MRRTFSEHYPPSDDELAKLWADGLIVVDTNVLLNLFRYSETASAELLSLLRGYGDRLWLPHQVGLEYQRKWWSTLHDQTVDIEKIEKQIAGTIAALENLHRHPTGESTGLTAKLVKRLRKSQKQLGSHRVESARKTRHQRTHDAITDLFDGRVGTPYDQERLKEIAREGDTRYQEKVPPGFEDAKKTEGRSYGDLILWLQILDKAKASSLPVIFVTDDDKDDWWLKEHGKKRGPHPALVKEFYDRSEQRVQIYAAHSFLAYAKKEQKAEISDATVREAKTVSTVRQFKLNAETSARMQRVFQQGWRLSDDLHPGDASAVGREAIERILRDTGRLVIPREQLDEIASRITELSVSPDSEAISRAADSYYAKARLSAMERRLEQRQSDFEESEHPENRSEYSDGKLGDAAYAD